MNNNEWTPNETWEDALARSREIRGPSDVKPVKWSCNPERKWVHLTESEWIGLHDAFDAMHKQMLALQDCSSDLRYELSERIEKNELPDLFDLKRWIMRLEDGQRGVWPPVAPVDTETP